MAFYEALSHDISLSVQRNDLTLCEQAGFFITHANDSLFYWPGYGRVGSWEVGYSNKHAGGKRFTLRYPLHSFADSSRQARFMASVCRRNAKTMAKFGIITDPDARKALDLCP